MSEIQRAFASGEVSPALYGRPDVDRWKSALKLCKNWIVQAEGGITVRQGFALQHTVTAGDDFRMVPFEFGPSDSYVLMFSGAEMTALRNGSIVLDDGTPDPFELATTLGGSSLRWVQSGDTIYFVDGVGEPQKLVREALGWEGSDVTRHDNWTIADAALRPTVLYGTPISISAAAGSDQIRYRMTYTDKDGIESSVVRGSAFAKTVSLSGTRWNVAHVAHGLNTNDTIEITSAKSNDAGDRVYEANDTPRILKVDADNFTIVGDGAVSGQINYAVVGDSEIGAQPTSGSPRVITWSAVPGADYYNLYREYGRVYGYIGSTSALTFSDPGIIPDIKDTPVFGISPTRVISAAGVNAPSAIGFFQQRLLLGGFSEDTERIVASHVGNYTAFDPGAEDASGLDFGLAGRTVSNIKHMVEIAGRSVVLTSTAEWVLRGGTSGALTPTAINARADSYHGCSDVAPVVVGTSLLFVQRGDRIIRDAKYDFSQEALSSEDLTLWAKHLFTAGIVRLVFLRTENQAWAVMADGKLRCLTYVPDQNIWGWSQHEVSGFAAIDACVVSEDGVDRLYVAFQDPVASTTKYITRLPAAWESENGDEDDHMGFDLHATYNGLLSGTGTLTGGTDWISTETLTLTASTSNFVVGDVGVDFQLRLGDDSVQVVCTAYTSGTAISVRPRGLVPESLQGAASDSLYRCADEISGLSHLNGQDVAIIADRGVEADATATAGVASLSRSYARIQAGIRVTATAQTLDLEADEKDTMLGDFKHVTRVVLRFLNSRGVSVGLSESTLEPMANEYSDVINAAPILQSGAREIIMDATHEDSGSIIMRQDSGLPATILNARTVFNMGDTR